MTTRRPDSSGGSMVVPLASRLRVARLHEAALHRQDRAHHPLRERGVVDPAGVADHDVLGHPSDEPVDAGAQRLDDAQPARWPGEQLEQRVADPRGAARSRSTSARSGTGAGSGGTSRTSTFAGSSPMWTRSGMSGRHTTTASPG